jgi:hypothetical protein
MKKTILLVICIIILFVSITSCLKSSKQKEDVSLFQIVQHSKYGFIDKTGKIVVNPQFDEVSGFSEGLSGVKLSGKWGFIDKTGKYVWNPTN